MRSQKLDVVGLVKGEYNYLYDLLPFHSSNMPLSKKINTVLSASNLVFKKANVYYMPISVFFEFTNYCNLRCPICATGNGHLERKSDNMKPELFEKAINQVNKYSLVASLWAWGESMLHPQLEDMMKIAYESGIKKGMQIVVSTNGQNLPKVADILLKYPPTYVICTVDGLTDNVLGQYRVGAKLDPILDGIKYIKQHRVGKYPILHMRTIVMKQNENQLSCINQWAKDKGFDNLSLRGLVQIIPNKDFEKLVPQSKEYQSYRYDSGVRVHNKCFWCRDSLMIPAVLTDGSLVACCEDFNARLCYGNLNEKSFKELWFGKKANHIRQTPTLRQDCKPCSICPMTDRTRPITNLEYRSLC